MRDDDLEVSLLKRELARIASSGDVVDIYRERLVSTGVLARVVQSSDHVVFIEQLDDNYTYDGVAAIRTVDVTRIRADDRELRAATALVATRAPARIAEIALIEVSAALTKLAQQHGAVTVYVEGLDAGMAIVGEPLDLDDDFILLRAWGTVRNGDDSRVLLRLPEITRVDADTTYMRRLRELRRG